MMKSNTNWTNSDLKTPNKKCNCCKLRLAVSNFNKTKDGCHLGLVSWCKSCCRIRNARRYKKIREQMLAQKAEYYKANVTRIKEQSKLTYNREAKSEYNKKWSALNRDKVRANSALRRARRNCATPSWLSESHKQQMRLYYTLALKLHKINNILYHVDHIVPLNGENVCGLHVPWNLQVIPATENLSKSNKHIYQ